MDVSRGQNSDLVQVGCMRDFWNIEEGFWGLTLVQLQLGDLYWRWLAVPGVESQCNRSNDMHTHTPQVMPFIYSPQYYAADPVKDTSPRLPLKQTFKIEAQSCWSQPMKFIFGSSKEQLVSKFQSSGGVSPSAKFALLKWLSHNSWDAMQELALSSEGEVCRSRFSYPV